MELCKPKKQNANNITRIAGHGENCEDMLNADIS